MLRIAAADLVSDLEHQLRFARAFGTFVESAYADCFECIPSPEEEADHLVTLSRLSELTESVVTDDSVRRDADAIRQALADLVAS
jgi:hypothetical protein